MSRFNLPEAVKPTTFNEGQRAVFGCLFACGTMVISAAAAGLVAIFVWGGWPEDFYGPIIDNLGWALILLIGIVGMGMAFLAVGGPVGRAKAKAGRDGFDFEASGDGEPLPPVIQPVETHPVPPADSAP